MITLIDYKLKPFKIDLSYVYRETGESISGSPAFHGHFPKVLGFKNPCG